MTATLEDLDIAEVLASRHPETPLWNDLLTEYDAEALDRLGEGWPDLMTAVDDEQPADDDKPPTRNEDPDTPSEQETAAPEAEPST